MQSTPEFRALLEYQQGLVSRPQLLANGYTRSMINSRLGGLWQLVHAGVVATFTGRLDPHQTLVAAQLFAGPLAYLSAGTAALWYGVEAAREPGLIRFTVPANLAARHSGPVRMDRTIRADEGVWQRGPLRIGSRARAVVSAARECRSERRALAIVVEAVQRRVVEVGKLRQEMEMGPRSGRVKVRLAIEAAEAGAWSVPESQLLDILSTSRILPAPWANPLLTSTDGERLPTPDVWIDDVALAIQVHSRAFHARDADWEATVSGDSLLGAHGIVVIGVTPHAISTEPERVRSRVEKAYLSLRGRSRAAVIAVPQRVLRLT